MDKVKIYAHVYKKLCIFFYVIFTFYALQAKEYVRRENMKVQAVIEIMNPLKKFLRQVNKQDQVMNVYVRLVQQIVNKNNGRGLPQNLVLLSRKIDKVDLLIKQKTLNVLNALDVDFQSLTNRMIILENNMMALAVVINDLSIVTQLGLINTTAASSALTTTLVPTNASFEIEMYNAAIARALAVVSTTLNNPLQENITAARQALSFAITHFDAIDSLISIDSYYSIAEIHAVLVKLSAQLAYLDSLQK
jgi:hypothetical protein